MAEITNQLKKGNSRASLEENFVIITEELTTKTVTIKPSCTNNSVSAELANCYVILFQKSNFYLISLAKIQIG